MPGRCRSSCCSTREQLPLGHERCSTTGKAKAEGDGALRSAVWGRRSSHVPLAAAPARSRPPVHDPADFQLPECLGTWSLSRGTAQWLEVCVQLG